MPQTQENGASQTTEATPLPQKNAKKTPEVPKTFKASMFMHGKEHLPAKFAALIQDLEANLGMPICLFLQDSEDVIGEISPRIFQLIFHQRTQLEKGKPVGLLIHSPGGSAKHAYEIARMLKTHCGGFRAIIPRFAKSAATLMTLGADSVMMGDYAELGPLDVQLFDRDRERQTSGLNEVQALERLHAVALQLVDRSMFSFVNRTGKKIDSLLPTSTQFVSELMKPLFAKIDTVQYTEMSRTLKVAEEYATRLMKHRYDENTAKSIARTLVEKYPDHNFFIDAEEANSIGLETEALTPVQRQILDAMIPFLGTFNAIGQIQEVTTQ